MISIKNVHNPKIEGITPIAYSVKLFNSLNEDFTEYYYGSGRIAQYILRKCCKIIFKGQNIVGLIWVDSFKKPVCYIKTIYFSNNISIEEIELTFKALFKVGTTIYAKTTEKDPCADVLKKCNFKENLSLDEMELSLLAYNPSNYNKSSFNELKITNLREGIDEVTRVKVQNLVFGSEARVPISLNDVKADKLQNYYIPEGNYFLKFKNEFIGYGQLIFYGNNLTLVNFGVIEEYRGLGYGEYFLLSILEEAKKMGYINIRLKVKSKNTAALNLYKKVGFVKNATFIEWKLKNKH